MISSQVKTDNLRDKRDNKNTLLFILKIIINFSQNKESNTKIKYNRHKDNRIHEDQSPEVVNVTQTNYFDWSIKNNKNGLNSIDHNKITYIISSLFPTKYLQ